jgi:hypothetical protein
MRRCQTTLLRAFFVTLEFATKIFSRLKWVALRNWNIFYCRTKMRWENWIPSAGGWQSVSAEIRWLNENYRNGKWSQLMMESSVNRVGESVRIHLCKFTRHFISKCRLYRKFYTCFSQAKHEQIHRTRFWFLIIFLRLSLTPISFHVYM